MRERVMSRMVREGTWLSKLVTAVPTACCVLIISPMLSRLSEIAITGLLMGSAGAIDLTAT